MATYYVRSSGGSDANDGLSFANGWATVQHAADTAIASDLVLICADGTHSPTVTVDFDTNSGTAAAPITFRGAGATGADDGTIATIDGGSLGAGDDLVAKGATSFLTFEQLIFSNATQYNFFYGTGGWTVFRRCRFPGATSDGFRSQVTGGGEIFFEDCEFDGNGGDGYGINSTNRGHAVFYRCSFHDNGVAGAQVSPYGSNPVGSPHFHRCLFYDNTEDGIVLLADPGLVVISHCTVFGNGGDGIDMNGAIEKLVVVDTILRSNGGYGINAQSQDADMLLLRRLCSHNNTSGHIDINGGTLPGTGHVLEDPQFVSETDGSEDFTPQNSNLKKTISLPVGLS